MTQQRTALVVSASPETRTGWARYFESLGFRTVRCVGPQPLCALLAGDARCPLHAGADVAVYDQTSVGPELMLRLIRSSRTVPIAFAADRVNDLGEHVPHVTALASDAYDRSCVGPGADLPLR